MGAALLFGIGPRHGARSREQRGGALLDALDASLRSIRWCSQVHGTDLITISTNHRSGAASVGPGDGLVTSEAGVGLVVWTADCVPVILVSPQEVAAVHAGWRGAAAGIVPKAVGALLKDGVEPARIHAYLGPAVSGPRYPVGNEVVEALKSHGVNNDLWLSGRNVDLRGFITGQLERLSVVSVTTVGGCTASDPRFASHRRDGEHAGRQWSLIYRAARV
jgi:YfiH family protein